MEGLPARKVFLSISLLQLPDDENHRDGDDQDDQTDCAKATRCVISRNRIPGLCPIHTMGVGSQAERLNAERPNLRG
jgi:hypothetical protein